MRTNDADEMATFCIRIMLIHIGVRGGEGRGGGGGGGGGGAGTPIMWRGLTYHLPPPRNNPPTFSFTFYVKQEKITNVPSRRVKI